MNKKTFKEHVKSKVEEGELFITFDIQPNMGFIPTGYDLVVFDEGESLDDILVLYGWDEVELFSHYNNPTFGFLKHNSIEKLKEQFN